MPHRSLIFALALAPLSAACSSDDSSDEPTVPGQNVDDVVYVGGTTDEALLQMLERTPRDVAAERLVIDSPEASAVLVASEPSTIAFHGGSSGRAAPLRDYAPLSFRERAWADLKQLFGPERAAHAHGTPYSGTGYFLVLDDARGNAVLRVFTSQKSHAIDSATWYALADVDQPLKLTITSAFFEENLIPTGGGPFVGANVEFTIE